MDSGYLSKVPLTIGISYVYTVCFSLKYVYDCITNFFLSLPLSLFYVWTMLFFSPLEYQGYIERGWNIRGPSLAKKLNILSSPLMYQSLHTFMFTVLGIFIWTFITTVFVPFFKWVIKHWLSTEVGRRHQCLPVEVIDNKQWMDDKCKWYISSHSIIGRGSGVRLGWSRMSV